MSNAEQKTRMQAFLQTSIRQQDLLNYDIEKLQAPAYLGLGDLAFTDRFRIGAIRYFQISNKQEKETGLICCKFLEENSFTSS